jgi:hypothetical protein
MRQIFSRTGKTQVLVALGFLLCGPTLGSLSSAATQGLVEPQRSVSKGSPKFCPQSPNPELRQTSWKRIAPDLVCEQTRIWTFPWHLAHGQDWAPTLGVAGVTSGLFLADNPSARYFNHTDRFDKFNSIFSGEKTKWSTVLVPVSLYGFSLIRHDSYGQETAILAGEALVNAELVTKAGKFMSGRLGPGSVSANTSFGDTWLRNRRDGSFPSGHAGAAFAVATVYARRYRNHKWVPYVAYGSAALVGFSTMTLSGHFGSDVFMGGALGYSISRFAVLR